MARHRHSKSHRRTNRHFNKNNKNIIDKTVGNSVSFAKNTSKKYMPKVKSGLENVGSKVVNTGAKSVPYLQTLTRKLFSKFSGKTKKNRKY